MKVQVTISSAATVMPVSASLPGAKVPLPLSQLASVSRQPGGTASATL